MQLECRTTREFIDIKVDEIEATIFKDRHEELDKLIINLLQTADDLATLRNISLDNYMRDLFE